MLGRRVGPVGVALIAVDVWRHLPAKHRQLVIEQTVKHGSRAGRYIVKEAARQIGKRLG